jgi:hypothetical protein
MCDEHEKCKADAGCEMLDTERISGRASGQGIYPAISAEIRRNPTIEIKKVLAYGHPPSPGYGATGQMTNGAGGRRGNDPRVGGRPAAAAGPLLPTQPPPIARWCSPIFTEIHSYSLVFTQFEKKNYETRCWCTAITAHEHAGEPPALQSKHFTI